MRVFLAGVLTLAFVPGASALTILKREPHHLAPRAVVYVETSQCPAGKVMKVTGSSKGTSRRKTCMSLEPREATLLHVPAL